MLIRQTGVCKPPNRNRKTGEILPQPFTLPQSCGIIEKKTVDSCKMVFVTANEGQPMCGGKARRKDVDKRKDIAFYECHL